MSKPLEKENPAETPAPLWDAFLTERDREVFAAAGWGQRMGFGKRPAVLVIDVCYGLVGDKREPILDMIKRWSNSCGEEAWDALGPISATLDAARAKGLPVIYVTGRYRKDRWDRGALMFKNARVAEFGQPGGIDPMEIVPQIAPQPTDILFYKQKPSAFFGTPLLSYLVLLGVDSLIVAGTSTSGCVRASVVDAFNHNYRVAVVGDACFDRGQASHAMSLFDMNAKYADVIDSGEAVAHIASLEDDLFVLPAGGL